MHFSLNHTEGELEVNHQASPGFSEAQAQRIYGPGHQHELLREGSVYRTPTLGCVHCGGTVVLNPGRTRNRNHCVKCNEYICDICHAETTKPDYVHRPWSMIRDMITSGKWYHASGPMSNPVLLPVIGE